MDENLLIDKIFWVRNNFYNKIDYFSNKISELESNINDVFTIRGFNLRLGFVYNRSVGGTSTTLHQYISDLICCNMSVASAKDYERKDTLSRINDLEHNYKRYLPIYKFECRASTTKDILDEIIKDKKTPSSTKINNRYVDWIKLHTSEIFPEYESKVSLYYNYTGLQLFIEIYDTSEILESYSKLLNNDISMNIKDSNLYHLVDNDLLEAGIYNIIEGINDSEYNLIKSKLGSYLTKFKLEISRYKLTANIGIVNYIIINNDLDDDFEFGLEIIKVEDDYFYVSIHYERRLRASHKTFKCDQLDGLLSMLNEFFSESVNEKYIDKEVDLKELSASEYDSYILKDNKDNLSNNDINIIKGRFSNCDIHKNGYEADLIIRKTSGVSIGKIYRFYHITIIKLEDEYFLIKIICDKVSRNSNLYTGRGSNKEIFRKYYLADQIDDVSDFLYNLKEFSESSRVVLKPYFKG